MGYRASVQFTNNLGKIADDVDTHLRTGLAAAGERLLALSSEQVPFDEGTLSGSGSVSTPIGTAEPTVEVIYDTPYAARLHEHPEYNFQGGRKGKYVEDPAAEHKTELGDIIRKEITK
ncbi:HK97 gp10 family phage protein [Paramicrobacterium sp. CJ85]|uniref:HK97 gp10 family phage protein n=1 Tax=Paramicrobacterium sp. CJ85 TaxID=3445355 RepID=UPI003F5FF9E7